MTCDRGWRGTAWEVNQPRYALRLPCDLLTWPRVTRPGRPPTDPGAATPARHSIAEILLAAAVARAADSSIVVLALPELYVELDTTIPDLLGGDGLQPRRPRRAISAVPLARRVRPAWLALAGLGRLLAASIVCAARVSLVPWSRAGRPGRRGRAPASASLPLLVALGGDRTAPSRSGSTAGTIGAAAGPALGGVLTEAFDWRAIFAVRRRSRPPRSRPPSTGWRVGAA